MIRAEVLQCIALKACSRGYNILKAMNELAQTERLAMGMGWLHSHPAFESITAGLSSRRQALQHTYCQLAVTQANAMANSIALPPQP